MSAFFVSVSTGLVAEVKCCSYLNSQRSSAPDILIKKLLLCWKVNPYQRFLDSPNASINVGYVRFNKALTVLTLNFFMLQFYVFGLILNVLNAQALVRCRHKNHFFSVRRRLFLA